jgi:hypothetical protein
MVEEDVFGSEKNLGSSPNKAFSYLNDLNALFKIFELLFSYQ